MKPGLGLAGAGLLLLLTAFACTPQESPAATPGSLPAASPTVLPGISGIVLDPQGLPLAGATVRIQATTNATLTDEAGRFRLSGVEQAVPVTVSAWALGYYCAKAEAVVPPEEGLVFRMRPVQTADNPSYAWIPPTGENSCYSCKPGVTQAWLDSDAHGRSAVNPRYLSMYNGTDLDGNRSPLTRYATSRDYGRFPLRPDSNQPYYGPGYRLDFPDTAGNCAACHNPGAALAAPYSTDPNTVSGVETFGIHCDYCHKIAAVRLDPQTGLPYPNMPGVLSQDVRRPFPDDPDRYQLFFGSFDDDNVPMEDTYLPLIQQSQFCAPCHFGFFWDTLIYNSYGEWLASPYSDPQAGRTCQQCHMPAPTLLDGVALSNVAPGMGGVERDPLTIPSHTFPGASSLELLQNSVSLEVTAGRSAGQVNVSVTVRNDQVGHHVPTDSPLRQMLLLVGVHDASGRPLALVLGPVVPEWGGVGDPQAGYYAGQPGQGYARILTELWTEISPSGAYWNPTRVVSDNRIPALGSDTTDYVFSSPGAGAVRVEVRLLYRRAFIELMDLKGWDVPDILMESETVELGPD